MITNINPFKPQHGVFTLPNQFVTKRQFIFGPNQWCDLTMWIAAETLKTSSVDIDALMERCANNNLNIRNIAIREWTRIIACAIIKKEAYKQFLVGEENYNGPKICERTRKTILMSDLTQIILDHRVKVQVWRDKQKQQKKQIQNKKTSPLPIHEPVAAEPVSELIIEDNSELDNWEDLDDD
jgi:hypothetical protein